MATSRMVAQIGRVVGGRYRLLAPIGTGASADVFVADDVTLRRRVAVKVLHAALAADDSFLRRFRAEARTVAGLRHPNIMAVFDWGEDDDGPYLVLEHLGGGSLRDVLDRVHRLSPSQALVVGLEAARALDYAHRRGLVHRDVKPANLLFDDEGRLCVADFGIARALAEATWTEPTGAVVGTVRYASPEQARGNSVDGRADIYALALVLVEAVTGSVPFVADTTIATLMARLDQPIPMSDELGPLAEVLGPAGAVDPADRPDAATLAAGLDRAAHHLPRPQKLPLAPLGALDIGRPALDPTVLSRPAVGRAVPDPGGGARSTAAPEALSATSPDDAPASGVAPPNGAPASGVAPPNGAPASGVAPPNGAPPPNAPETAPATSPTTGVNSGANSITPRSTLTTPMLELAAEARRSSGHTGMDPYTISASEELASGDQVPFDPLGARRAHRAWWRRGWLGALLAVAAALTVGTGIGVVLIRVLTPTYPVPVVTAQQVATHAPLPHRFVLVVHHGRRDGTHPGDLLGQNPAPGTPRKTGSTIAVSVSDGPTLVAIPTLVGVDQSAATASLTRVGLVPGTLTTQLSDHVPRGQVIAATPPSGLEPKGTAINLVVSLGPLMLPDLRGTALDSAQSTLAGLGLTNTVAHAFDDTVPAGSVIRTSPGPGPVPQGSAVQVTVSDGPQVVVLPDLRGLSVDAATRRLQSLGLLVGSVYGPHNARTVVATNPDPGTQVPHGTPVDLYITR